MPEGPIRAHTTQLLQDVVLAAAASDAPRAASRPESSSLRDNRAAANRLLELVYDDLKALAASHLKKESPTHTLQPTALAHEAFMVLIDQSRVDWKGRSHFLAIASQAMRRILIDHARGRDRQKRGGGWKRVAIQDGGEPAAAAPASDIDIEALDDALSKLADVDERQARIVEMRYLGGMTVEEVAEALGVSKRTVEGDWTMARAWLRKELAGLG
jgi:RNA polymerase sigma-70 factor, ECF subfamily